MPKAKRLTCPRCRKKIAVRDKGDSVEFYPHDYDYNLPCSQPPIKKVKDPAVEAEKARYTEDGQLRHEWAEDELGIIRYELGEYHDGPRCIRCDVTRCQHCYPDFLTEACSEQTGNLF